MITKRRVCELNLSTVALILLAWQVLSKNNDRRDNSQSSPTVGLTDFLSDDTKNMLDCFGKLSNGTCSQEDRTSAIFQMMANPAVMNIASNLFGGFGATNASTTDTTPRDSQSSEKTAYTNSEGYKFETPTAESVEFFRPIDNIADAEIKHKLYRFYDNWYVK